MHKGSDRTELRRFSSVKMQQSSPCIYIKQIGPELSGLLKKAVDGSYMDGLFLVLLFLFYTFLCP